MYVFYKEPSQKSKNACNTRQKLQKSKKKNFSPLFKESDRHRKHTAKNSDVIIQKEYY